MSTNAFENQNPFASPRSSGFDELRRGRVATFVSGHLRATIAIGMLVISMVASAGAIASTTSQLGLIARMMAGQQVFAEEARANDVRQKMIVFGDAAWFYVTAIGFLFWIYRAHRNLAALGNKKLEFTAGSAVWWWFVPFANLVVPLQVMRQIWTRSDPASLARIGPSTALLGIWWGCYLLRNIGGWLVGMTYNAPSTLAEVREASVAVLPVYVLSIVAATLAILLIRGIDRRQELRYERLLEQPPPAEPIPPSIATLGENL